MAYFHLKIQTEANQSRINMANQRTEKILKS